MKFWKRWISDLRGKTMGCSLVQRGAYDALLDEYYTHESPLPSDRGALYRIAGAIDKQEQSAVDYIVNRFFQLHGDGLLHNPRADEYLAHELGYSADQSERGKKGAQKRWQKEESHAVDPSPPTPKATRANGKHGISDDWLPSPETIERLSSEFKLTQAQVQQYFDHFVGMCKAKDYKYADFDAAFSNSVRSDWPKLRESSKPAKFDPFNPGPGKAVM